MSSSYIPTKDKHKVRVTLEGGDDLEGYLFAAADKRLVDMLNDDRKFLPFEDNIGDITIISKEAITKIADLGDNRSLRVKAR